MHFQERERQGELGATLGDMEVTGVKQHELVDWYFAHQSERWVPSRDVWNKELQTRLFAQHSCTPALLLSLCSYLSFTGGGGEDATKLAEYMTLPLLCLTSVIDRLRGDAFRLATEVYLHRGMARLYNMVPCLRADQWLLV